MVKLSAAQNSKKRCAISPTFLLLHVCSTADEVLRGYVVCTESQRVMMTHSVHLPLDLLVSRPALYKYPGLV